MTKLYVGNLPYSATNQELQDMFAAYGNVVSANIIMDRHTGQSKGFGFVELEDDAMAEKAIKEINGSDRGGRNVIVSVARPREERPMGGGGGGRDSRGGDRGDRGGFNRNRR